MLNVNIQTAKIMASNHHFMANRCEKKWKHWQILFSWAPKSLRTVIVATKLKDAWSFEENVWQTYTVCIKKQRYHFAHKDLYNQSYGFYGSHVQMWELHHKEGWAPKNDAFELWCWRRLLRVPWTARRSNQSILKEISPEYSLEGLMLKSQYFDHLMWRTDSMDKTLMLGKIEDRSRREWQRIRWLDSIAKSVDMIWASSRR